MTDWKPIDTAPKDGTWIMALSHDSVQDSNVPGPFVFTTRWIDDKEAYWEQVDGDTMKQCIRDCSHWYGHECPAYWSHLPELTDSVSDTLKGAAA